MNVYRGLYYATLTGMAGGLLAWSVALLVSVPLVDRNLPWLPASIQLLIFGIFVGVLLFLHFDRALSGKMKASSVGYGMLLGTLAAVAASALAFGLQRSIAFTSPTLYRIAEWTLCFSLVSLGLGLRWVRTNLARVLHTYAGGLAGALRGGVSFTIFATHLPTGAGTGFGAGIAPILVREGAMRFISSGDARAQSKLGKSGKYWNLEVGESYCLGSAVAGPVVAQGSTRFQQGVDIYIPDTAIAPRHAIVFSKGGRYYIARHPDAAGPEGIARYVLRIKGKTVVATQELPPSAALLVGRTAFRFDSRNERQS